MGSSRTTILSIITLSLALSTLHSSHSTASAMETGYTDVINDQFIGLNPRTGSRFLAEGIKKGDSCDSSDPIKNICPGIPAKDGEQLLNCCKLHCRNVLTDRNNCGVCGNKCGFGQLCCAGNCTMVAYDVSNCGKCGTKCKAGVRCEYGTCGYA